MKNKASKVNKEALKQFLDELLSTKFSKEQLLHFLKEDEKEEQLNLEMEEEEVCVEPFAFTDADGDVLPITQYEELNPEEFDEFKNLTELEMCPGLEINEENILSDEIIDLNEKVELDEEELDAIQQIADQIEPIEAGACIPCVVNGEDKYLIDGVNCNIKEVTILGLSLITPINLEVLKVYIDSDMESEKEIEVTVALKVSGNVIVYKFFMGVLLDAGIISVADGVELELTPLEFRGVMKKVDVDELAELLIV